jgi:hypothetical protein
LSHNPPEYLNRLLAAQIFPVDEVRQKLDVLDDDLVELEFLSTLGAVVAPGVGWCLLRRCVIGITTLRRLWRWLLWSRRRQWLNLLW